MLAGLDAAPVDGCLYYPTSLSMSDRVRGSAVFHAGEADMGRHRSLPFPKLHVETEP